MRKFVTALAVLVLAASSSLAQSYPVGRKLDGPSGTRTFHSVPDYNVGKFTVESNVPISFGTCTLSSIDFGTYGDRLLDSKLVRNFEFSTNLTGVSYTFAPGAKMSVGVRVTYSNYYFLAPMYFVNEGREMVPYYPQQSVRKSKIRTDYVGFPLGLSVESGGIRFSCNVSAEFLAKAVTKCKTGDGRVWKEEIFGINRFRSVIQGTFSYKGFGVYVNYCLTPFFEPGFGRMDTHSISFGLLLDL